MISVGLIGYGRNGSIMHAPAIDASERFRFAAICDIDEAARKAAAEKFGCPVYADYREMLRREEIDLVVIITPSDCHASIACDCLRAGKRVLVTKPMGISMEEIDEMIAVSRETGAQLLPWLPARWGCDLRRLREVIASGVIGDVFQIIRSEFTFGKRNDWQIWSGRGGGYTLNWGPHLVDQPMQLVGGSVKEVFAFTRQVINPGDAEDVFYAMLQMDNGVSITCEYNIATPGVPHWIIRGSKGTIYVDRNEFKIDTVRFPENIPDGTYRCEVTTGTYRETMRGDVFGDTNEVYAHIAQVVEDGAEYAVALDSARALMQTLFAIKQSAQEGHSLTLIP